MTKIIIDAVRYLHLQGIIHKNLNPENILTHSKRLGLKSLKLVDFGISKFFGERNLDHIAFCSSNYVAPEIIFDNSYGKECDYWSIGALIYVMLSGEFPFKHRNIHDFLRNINNS